MRRWEFVGGKSNKFWEAELDGATVTTRYGRIGTNGQSIVKKFDSPAKAESHLNRLIAEKVKKGYAEVVATTADEPSPGSLAPEPAGLPDEPAPEPAPASPVPEPAGLPDEDTFVMPASWRRVLHPRHGGVARTTAPADPDAAAEVGHWLREAARNIDELLAHPSSDPQLVKEARACLDGDETPQGTAVVSQIVVTSARVETERFADTWVAAHGLAFAARTLAELADVKVNWPAGPSSAAPWLAFRSPGEPFGWGWWWKAAAARVRALLAAAGDDDYRAVVRALAGHRGSAAQRLVVAYLAPTETAWVDECCAAPPSGGYQTATDSTLLFTSLSTPGQVAALGDRARFDWGQWSLDVLATVVEGVGTAIAPMLVAALDEESGGAGGRRLALDVLSRLPTDEAFQLMLDRVEGKYVQPALLEAMRRFPVRALRLLARAADGKNATARRLLGGHLLAQPEPTAAALPGLPEDVRAVVASLSGELTRVAAVPIGSLPRPLADPPWTRRRKTAAPAVVAGLEPPDEAAVVWADGERERWRTAGAAYAHWRSRPWEEAVRDYHAGKIRGYEEIGLFLHGPADLIGPLLADWRPSWEWDADTWMKAILAAYELAALPAALRVATANPASAGVVLLPFRDVRVARLMADWLVRLKSARRTALAWFGRHGAEAASLLVPDAVGATGHARAAAEAALRLIATTRDVRPAARAYGSEAEAAVETLLAADPLDDVPARMPKPGAWADPALLPQVLLRDRARALPPEATGHLLTMLAISRPGQPYAGIEVVREVCDPASLAEFGWAVFERWRTAGMPSKDGWALTGLGVLGDDETVRRLTPVIRAWPGDGGHARAVTGLDVLAEIGTEIALVHLNGISQRVKFKGLKVRAQEKIQEVARGLGLSTEQLADRLVPDFGLDDDGSMVLDYGPRRFVVGFDEQLKPYVADESGKRRKDLPAPGARDDEEMAPAARKRFAALKKDVRTIAGDVIRRLETAMVARRGWTVAEFTDLFVRHPLTWHLARRLVWSAGGAEFRVAEDRTLADVEDDPYTLPAGATVTIAHPVTMPGTVEAWAEVFADYEILQPFPQLGRPVYALTDEERAGARLTRFEGVTVPTTRLLGMQRRGWARGEPQDAGIERWFSREAGADRFIVLGLEPGIAAGYVDEFPEQRLDAVWINSCPDDYWPSRKTTLRFGDLDPVMASEVVAELTELTNLPRSI